MPKFWHIDQHGRGGQPADPRDCHEPTDTLIESAPCLCNLSNDLIYSFDVCGYVINAAVQLFPDKRIDCGGKTRLRGDLVFDECPPGCQQLSEIMDIFRFCVLWRKVKNTPHTCQHPRIDGICLC